MTIPFIAFDLDHERDNIADTEVWFFIACVPVEESHIRIFLAFEREVFFVFSEVFALSDRDILEEPEWTRIADPKWSESIDCLECEDIDLMSLDT